MGGIPDFILIAVRHLIDGKVSAVGMGFGVVIRLLAGIFDVPTGGRSSVVHLLFIAGFQGFGVYGNRHGPASGQGIRGGRYLIPVMGGFCPGPSGSRDFRHFILGRNGIGHGDFVGVGVRGLIGYFDGPDHIVPDLVLVFVYDLVDGKLGHLDPDDDVIGFPVIIGLAVLSPHDIAFVMENGIIPFHVFLQVRPFSQPAGDGGGKSPVGVGIQVIRFGLDGQLLPGSADVKVTCYIGAALHHFCITGIFHTVHEGVMPSEFADVLYIITDGGFKGIVEDLILFCQVMAGLSVDRFDHSRRSVIRGSHGSGKVEEDAVGLGQEVTASAGIIGSFELIVCFGEVGIHIQAVFVGACRSVFILLVGTGIGKDRIVRGSAQILQVRTDSGRNGASNF